MHRSEGSSPEAGGSHRQEIVTNCCGEPPLGDTALDEGVRCSLQTRIGGCHRSVLSTF
jgi:hypothetical protein